MLMLMVRMEREKEQEQGKSSLNPAWQLHTLWSMASVIREAAFNGQKGIKVNAWFVNE